VAGRVTKVEQPNIKVYADTFVYAAQGAVASLHLSNGLFEHTNFNNRLQPTQIGLGTSARDSSTLKLDYTYGTSNNNGNLQSQTITTPDLTVTQSYTYDALIAC
jgi:hypothetical protein